MQESPKFENNLEAENESVEPLRLTTSPEGLPAIQITDASEKTRAIIRRAVTANHFDDPSYQLRNKAGAFLQGDQERWILVEFWQGSTDDQQAFVDHLNKLLLGELKKPELL